MTSNTSIARNYIEAFARKDIETISTLLSETASLRDWDVEIPESKEKVLDFMQSIFSSVESIEAEVLHYYSAESAVVIEMNLHIDGQTLKVVDVINFCEDSTIKSIRAYQG